MTDTSALVEGRTLVHPGWDVLQGDAMGEERPPTLLVLAGAEINRRVLRGMLKDEGYRMLEATHSREALQLLRTEKVDLIVLELSIPQANGLEFCRRVKGNRETRFTPVVMMTSVQGVENEIAGLLSGADEFLVKPLNPAVVRTRIRAMLRQKRAIDSLEESESILFALAQAVEHRDSCTSGHCERLATLSMALGTALGLSRPHLLALHRGGYLHDIGKIGIPDAILFKPGPLTQEEWAIMRTHSIKGEEICRPARTLAPVLPIIRNHHERWDGSGYPDGLRGDEIPLLARILQTADIFDALTSSRPYKAALPPEKALKVLDDEVKRGWRDPQMIELLHGFCTSPAGQGAAEMLTWPSEFAVERSLDNMRGAIEKQS